MKVILSAVLIALSPIAYGAGNDELWEVTSQMNMAGMPPGMGSSKQQICQDKDPQKQKPSGKGMEKCKITDQKQSGNKFTMTMTCPEGTATFENTYNAARTEYKGTMKMKMREGEMNMTMTGRKIGSCDAQQARGERDAKVAAMKQQSEKAQADYAATNKKQQETEMANCQAAVDTMDMRKLGTYATCDQTGALCKTLLQTEHTKATATKCMASQAEYCKRYQTMDGFLKAKGDEEGAKMCKVSAVQIKSTHCPQAAKTENLAYLGRFCPVEAKPIAQQHCAGRSYTSKVKDKYSDFCRAYLAKADLEDSQAERKPEQKKDPKAAVTEGVSQGINKLKGLFGR